MKLNKERLLNAGVSEIIFQDIEFFDILNDKFSAIRDIKIRINKNSIVTFLDNAGDSVLQKEEKNNFEPQSPYKGHEARIKELEDKVQRLLDYTGLDKI